MFLLIYQSSYRTICLIMSHTSNLHHLSSMYAPSATLILAMSFTHSLRLVQTFHLYYLFNIPPRSSISSPPSLPSFSFFTYCVPIAFFTTLIFLFIPPPSPRSLSLSLLTVSHLPPSLL